jgi:hypothetical protein
MGKPYRSWLRPTNQAMIKAVVRSLKFLFVFLPNHLYEVKGGGPPLGATGAEGTGGPPCPMEHVRAPKRFVQFPRDHGPANEARPPAPADRNVTL